MLGVGTTLSIRGSGVVARRSVSKGVSVRHLSLLSDSRKLPENWLPPDFVMMLTTPPLNRPNSAETPPLATVVSWMASSIAVSNACPRMFSLMLTPFRRNRFSKLTEPPNEKAPAGPVGVYARRHHQDRVGIARRRELRDQILREVGRDLRGLGQGVGRRR